MAKPRKPRPPKPSLNGHAKTVPLRAQLSEKKLTNDLTKEVIKGKRLERAARMREAFEVTDWNWMSIFTDYIQEIRKDGYFPGIGTISDKQHGANWPFYRTEMELNLHRSASRVLATANQHAEGLLGNLSGYIIGTGMVSKCSPQDRTADPVDKKLCAMTQAVIDEFDRRNKVSEWQITSFVKSQEDGDFYFRLFNEGGYASLRHVLPELVRQPPGGSFEEWSFGHRTEIDDAEKFLSFWISSFDSLTGEEVQNLEHNPDADDSMVWFPAFLPRNMRPGVKRGLPLFAFGTREAINSVEKLERNTGLGTAVRQAYAFLRKWTFADESQVSDHVSSRADYTVTRMLQPDVSRNVERIEPGRVEDVPDGMDFVNPPTNPETQYAILVADMLYRSAGQAWGVPEWMMSGNSANMAAYTAALVAESHIVKRWEQAQAYHKLRFLIILNAVVRFAVRAGRLPPEVLTRVKVDITPPTVQVRDKGEEAQQNQIYVGMGAKSRQMVAEENNWDFERVISDNKDFQAATQPAAPAGAAGDKPPETAPGGTQQIPMPGATQGEPEEGDLDPFGDVAESLRESKLLEAALREEGFSGTITDKAGRKRKYVDGKPVAIEHPNEPEPTSPTNQKSDAMSFQNPAQAEAWAKKSFSALSGKASAEHKKAVERYAKLNYLEVNESLRGGKYKDYAAPIVDKLDDLMESDEATIPEQVKVYRGVSADIVHGLKEGMVFQDHGFVSTSFDRSMAELHSAKAAQAGESGGAVVEITVPKGAAAFPIDAVLDKSGDENELLIDRGGRYKVTGIRNEGGQKIIQMELITSNVYKPL